MTVYAGLDFTHSWPYLSYSGITCAKGDTVETYFFITSRNGDRKIMKPIRTISGKSDELLLKYYQQKRFRC